MRKDALDLKVNESSEGNVSEEQILIYAIKHLPIATKKLTNLNGKQKALKRYLHDEKGALKRNGFNEAKERIFE